MRDDQILSSPIGLPAWPRWSVADDRRSCNVSGWHLTPARSRVARFLAVWSTLAVLVFPGWYFWQFQNIPAEAWEDVKTVAAKFGFYSMTYTNRKWVLVGLWFCCWLAWRLWEWLFYLLYSTLLWERTTIRFTIAHVTLSRFSRKYERAAKIAFSAKQHPKLLRLKAKAQRQGSNTLAVFYEEIRVLVMEHGQTTVPAAYFRWPEDADRFAAVCLFALSYPLKKPEERPAGGTRPTQLENDDDV